MPGKVGGVLRRELGDCPLLAALTDEGDGDVGGQRWAEEDLATVRETDPASVKETVDVHGQQDAVVGV